LGKFFPRLIGSAFVFTFRSGIICLNFRTKSTLQTPFILSV
jgi:hypothetical protein